LKNKLAGNVYKDKQVDARLGKAVGTLCAILKMNYVRLLKRVELYQPIQLPEKFIPFVVRATVSSRKDVERYDYVVNTVLENNNSGIHLDVGCQFGYIPIALAKNNVSSIGIELQYFSYIVAKNVAQLNRFHFVNIVNGNIVELIDEIPIVDSMTALSILHHVVAEIDDVNLATEFLEKLFRKVRKRIVLEVADIDEGNYLWCKANTALFDGKTAECWFAQFLTSQGFKVSEEVKKFETHLQGERPILIADRV